MTSDEQLALWVDGKSVHNHDATYSVVNNNGEVVGTAKAEGGGTEQRRHELLMTFLAAAMSRAGDKRAHIAGRGESS